MKTVLYLKITTIILASTLKIEAQMDIRKQNICATSPVAMYTVKGVEGMKFHWIVEGGILASEDINNDTIWVQWNGLGEHRLSVYGEYQGCYTNKKDLIVQTKNPPIVNLGPDVEICQDERFTFEIDEGYSSVIWHDSSTGRWFTVQESGTVWVKVSNAFGCEAVDSARVVVHPLPSVYLGKDTMLCGNATLTVTAFNNQNADATYIWSLTDAFGFNITDPAVTLKNEGIYWVRVTDINGCSNSDTIAIIKCDKIVKKNLIPTVFTPNGDGKNDVWRIDELSIAYPDGIVTVYDRWGRLVYRSKKGYPEPWDGKDINTKRPLPMDNYFYIIYPNKKGENSINGTVTIAR